MKTREPIYWRSRDELEQNAAFQQRASQEFASDLVTEEMDGTTRRHFLGIMGASMTMTSLAGCVRRPEEYIMPYAQAPEDVLPGIPTWYATAANIGGDVVGLLVESNEGRPTKIEGNPEHPVNLGRTNSQQQGLVLDLYDPARLKTPRQGPAPASWDAAADTVKTHFAGLRDKSGRGLAILSRSNPSPSFYALRDKVKRQLPMAQWYTYESISYDNQRKGIEAAFGAGPRRPRYRLNKAGVVVSLDSDFLATERSAVSNAGLWAERRRVSQKGDDMSRLYAVEGVYSVTGSNADHRLRVRPSEVEAFAFGLATELEKTRGFSLPADLKAAATARSATLTDEQKAFAAAIAKDLANQVTTKGGRREGLIIAGRRQPPVVHALVAAMNQGIQANGVTVVYYNDYTRPADSTGDMAEIKALTDALNAGQVDTVLVLGANPVYDAPGDLNFGEAFAKAKHRFVLASHPNETAKAATWALPQAHFLETWGDLVAIDGTPSIQQPLIDPLYGAWSAIELLARVLGQETTDGYSLVRGHWKDKIGKVGFFRKWRRWLHDGVIRESALQFVGRLPADKRSVQGARGLLEAPATTKAGPRSLELVFTQDIHLFDGRFSNNAWLLEAPDPMSKLVWDNAVMVSPATAEVLSISNEDRVSLEVGGKAIDLVAWVMPGMAPDTAQVTLGYGCSFDNFLPYHDEGTVGFDVNPVRSSSSPDLLLGAVLAKRPGKYPLATVQPYDRLDPGFGYERRPHVRETTLAEFNDPKANNETFAQPGIIEHGGKFPQGKLVAHPPEKALHPDPVTYDKGYQWGMVIDLNTCTGCNTCIVACQAENNIMAVGKDQVRRGREMHWIRVDRYFTGDYGGNADVVHQPIVCMQCEMAPCENVCPVAATVHSPEGLNDMAYNRCIGTRYCANNCPFKVRKFNFYNYSKDQPETYHMVRNPDVTVRFRGVMEKCTYCTQRITRGKRRANEAVGAEAKRREINAITPACAQACPSGSIVFGDIRDPESRVSKLRAQDRNYRLLTELNIRPRTSYLALIRNPNPELKA